MMLNHDIINYNIGLLEQVKTDFPIIGDFESGKVSRESVIGIGLDEFVHFIDFCQKIKKTGQLLVYDTSPNYRDIKQKIVESCTNQKSKSIFQNKSKNDFIKIFKDHKLHRRYTRYRNSSYAQGLETCEPIIINFLILNKIDFETTVLQTKYYTYRLVKPHTFHRELKKTQEFVELFLNYAHEQEFDLRKCNIKSLTAELNSKLRSFMFISPGLKVRSLVESKFLTKDVEYEVLETRINYQGYLEVKITDNAKLQSFYPYSFFEEKSRERHDIIRELGI